jgi:hypothetical protein
LLLFLGLLTLLNAPFDCALLGLTRALLRRGLELGGWWPYLLGLVDAALATVITACLALVMVIGVQAFDELAVNGGGTAVLVSRQLASKTPETRSLWTRLAHFTDSRQRASKRSLSVIGDVTPGTRGKPGLGDVTPGTRGKPGLNALFDGIAKNPAEPEYWWAYALLLSTMIPSLVNLAIGGMAFTRGIPWLARLLLQWIPAERAVPEYKRHLAAIGVTAQMFAGAGLGLAAQGFLALVIIHYAIPLLGLDLLDMARAVAAFDLPMQLWQIFARIL